MYAMKPGRLTFLVGFCWIMAASPAAAQRPVTINGRVEDAVTLQPLPGIRITAGDSTTSTLTRLDGTFALEVDADGPLVLYVEGFGYEFKEFDLPPESVGRVSVLRLEPDPYALAGIDVIAQQAVDALLANLAVRRRGYSDGSAYGFNRGDLERFSPTGASVLDFVRQRNPRLRTCEANGSEYLCVPGRIRPLAGGILMDAVFLCVDGRPSRAPIPELASLPVESVSLVEFFGRSRIHVYTQWWVLSRVRTGRTTVPSLRFGC